MQRKNRSQSFRLNLSAFRCQHALVGPWASALDRLCFLCPLHHCYEGNYNVFSVEFLQNVTRTLIHVHVSFVRVKTFSTCRSSVCDRAKPQPTCLLTCMIFWRRKWSCKKRCSICRYIPTTTSTQTAQRSSADLSELILLGRDQDADVFLRMRSLCESYYYVFAGPCHRRDTPWGPLRAPSRWRQRSSRKEGCQGSSPSTEHFKALYACSSCERGQTGSIRLLTSLCTGRQDAFQRWGQGRGSSGR